MDDRDRALYIISVAASLAGVHAQTLRFYERKGLIEPQRTPSGYRKFSQADVELKVTPEVSDAPAHEEVALEPYGVLVLELRP